jgi:hypothetical protein
MLTAAPTTIDFSEDFQDFGFRKKKPKHTQAAARCTGRPDGFIYFGTSSQLQLPTHELMQHSTCVHLLDTGRIFLRLAETMEGS